MDIRSLYTTARKTLRDKETAMQACILIIDDDPFVRDVLAKIIRQIGYVTIEANNGAEGLQILSDPSQPEIDMVFTDIMMPRMSGLEVLQAVREMRPEMPVAMITGAASLDNSIAALNAGAYAYMVKPLRIDQVREITSKGVRLVEQARERLSMQNELVQRYERLQTQLQNLQSEQAQPPVPVDPLAELIRGLRHELGNAATAIKLNLSVLEQEGNNPRALREHLKDLETSADELVALIDRLKQYPRQQASRDKVDVRQMILTLAEMNSERLAEYGLRLTLYGLEAEESQTIVYVSGTDVELVRVGNHILNNAIDATLQAGGKNISISLERDENEAYIIFRDEGTGIPEEHLADVFSPGYTTKMTDGMVRGLGLGLFVARATVSLYGGQISLKNMEAGGLEATISLPLIVDEIDY